MGLISQTEKTNPLAGTSTIRAFEPGAIQELLNIGMPLNEAIECAVKTGKCRYENISHNLVVTAGKQMVADMLIGEVTTGLTYHAIGTGDTAPGLTDTQLTTEATRKAITLKSRSGNTITLSTYYTKTTCAYDIKEGGIFGNAASATPDSGTLFCHFLHDYDNSEGNYDLTFEYNLEVQ